MAQVNFYYQLMTLLHRGVIMSFCLHLLLGYLIHLTW